MFVGKGTRSCLIQIMRIGTHDHVPYLVYATSIVSSFFCVYIRSKSSLDLVCLQSHYEQIAYSIKAFCGFLIQQL